MFDVAIKPAQTESVKTGKQSERSNSIVLQGSFSTGDYTYKFELSGDGTGKIIYPDCPTEHDKFFLEVNVENLAREIEVAIGKEFALKSQTLSLDDLKIQSIRQEVGSEMLEEVFWEEINQRLEDPFFRSAYDDSEWGEEFRCERGTTEEFIEFLKLCVLTEREIEAAEEFLIVEAETDFDLAGLSECSYFTERLGELVEIACEYYKPTGFSYHYNDGCYDRMSGYSTSSESVTVSLADFARVPAGEKSSED
jgi:hypothetical protein